MHTDVPLKVVATDAGDLVLSARTGPAETDIVARVTAAGFHGPPEQREENARRLAACWNLCLGIPERVLADCAAKQTRPARLDALAKAVPRHDVGSSATPPSHTRPSNWHG